ncbi:hypothetical protein [Paraburkholderia sp. UCT31]|uniref:hypothetical protein n=1 Tax=Paraburkholderia sp. UCT31 TaxID=2615209 RepID=UPI0016557774|nr:hypothetical protein [Paraburkholderia sp. UCT31]
MEEISYRGASTGKISVYRGSKKLSEPWLDVEVPPGPTRAILTSGRASNNT